MIRNPFTSHRAGWPRYEYRVTRTTYNRWSYYKATYPSGMTTPSEVKLYKASYYQKEDARDSACDDARVMSMHEIAHDLPPNPNPVIVYGFDGRPECAYIAGSSVSWDELEEMGYGPYFKNPKPRTIVLNPEEYGWAEWAIDGMEGMMSDEDYEEHGYQPDDIPPLKRVGAQAWLEVSNLNALEDLLYRLENQAKAMVDYEIKQFRQNGLPVPAHLKAQKAAQLSLARKLRRAFDSMSVS